MMMEPQQTDFHTGQFNLIDRPREAVKAFLKQLSESDVGRGHTRFDVLDASKSAQRQVDHQMDLDRFLAVFDRVDFMRFQIGSPFPQIRLCLSGPLFEQGAIHYAWVEAPLNPRNYAVLKRVFHEVFGEDLESLQSL